jgi:hypothetical protein
MRIIYDDEAWQAVAGNLPPRMDADQARRELEQIGVDHRTMESARKRRPTKRDIQSTHRAIQHVLANVKLSDAARAELTAQDQAREIGYAMLRKAYSRKANPNQALLYDRILRMWRQGGGSTQYSTEANGRTPSGPLIRFLAAVLRPVLGDGTPKPSGLADIIDRERDRIWIHRLHRARPDLAKRVLNEEISASAAAIEAGVRDPI